jgi:hypothetical protein
MKLILSIAGAIAGAVNLDKEFSIPIMRADTHTKGRYGKRMARSLLIRGIRPIFTKPGAMIVEMKGERAIPMIVIVTDTTMRRFRIIDANSDALSLLLARELEKTGMKAAESAPSPKSLLVRFGTSHAAKKSPLIVSEKL